MSKYLISGTIGALTFCAFTCQSQEFIVAPGETINDFISLGEFNEVGNIEGWRNNATNLDVENGVLNAATIGGDPHFFITGIEGASPEFHLVEMRLRILEGTKANWDMFWGEDTPGAGGFVGGRRFRHSPDPVDEEFFIVQYDLSTVLTGALSDFRIDPGGGAGTVVEVDYVRLGKTSPDSDGDGLPNVVESNTGVFVDARDTGTDPNKADTDGDGINDAIEVSVGADPNNSADVPVEGIRNYTLNSAVYVVQVPIEENVPDIAIGTPSSFSVNPALPGGLALSQATGTISGTPTEAREATDYAITANFVGGSSSEFVINLQVRPPFIEYTVSRQALRLDQVLPDFEFVPKIFGEAPTSYAITPALPEGVEMDPTVGDIFGTPFALSPPTEYTVTASYADHPNSSTQLTLSVLGNPRMIVDPETTIEPFLSLGEFDDESDIALWSRNPRIGEFFIQDGSLVVETTGGDPFMSTRFTGEGPCLIVEIRVKAVVGSSWQFFWGENSPGRTNFGAPGQPFNTGDFVDDGEFHVYQIDLSTATEAELTAFRWDPSGGEGAIYELDYARVLDCTMPPSEAPTLAIERAGQDVIISWEGSSTLQSASDIGGPWTDLGQTSPATFPTSGEAAAFYRARSN